MTGRRIGALALFALTAGSLVLAGCGSGQAPGPRDRTQMSPAAAIGAAIGDLAKSTYAVEITTTRGDRADGVIDPGAGVGTLSSTSTVKGGAARLDAVMVRPNIWVKLDFGARSADYGIPSKSWMQLDAAKAVSSGRLPIDLGDFGDALDMKRLLAGVDAKRSDANHLDGSIDLTRASGVSAPAASDVAGAGANARHVPVTIALDEQGRLIEVNIKGATPGLACDIRFSDYGLAARVTRPDDDQIVPTPDRVYQLLPTRKAA